MKFANPLLNPLVVLGLLADLISVGLFVSGYLDNLTLDYSMTAIIGFGVFLYFFWLIMAWSLFKKIKIPTVENNADFLIQMSFLVVFITGGVMYPLLVVLSMASRGQMVAMSLLDALGVGVGMGFIHFCMLLALIHLASHMVFEEKD